MLCCCWSLPDVAGILAGELLSIHDVKPAACWTIPDILSPEKWCPREAEDGHSEHWEISVALVDWRNDNPNGLVATGN
jgi:Fe-S-cluster containining protein